MDWASLGTAIAALAVAGLGYWTSRKAGIPTDLTQAIRDELNATIAALTSKADRLQSELEGEKEARAIDARQCSERIEHLTEGIVERDLVIQELYRRLGMKPPAFTDPRG